MYWLKKKDLLQPSITWVIIFSFISTSNMDNTGNEISNWLLFAGLGAVGLSKIYQD